MGLWSKWHYTTRAIGGWIHNNERQWLYIHTPIAGLCNTIHITGQMPSRCYIIHLHVNLSNNVSTYDSLNFTLISLPAAGCVRRWLLWYFESRTRAAVARAAILIVVALQFMSDVMLKWTVKSWTVTRAIMWLLCEHGIEASNDWVLAHISSIHSTPRCRCRAHTYTPKPRCRTSYADWLAWAVRLWIFGRSPSM